ncbi:MAG: phosphate/phosphite/phosphonate ABC transporter substrate-binding protein [Deltaproteobacteria bacterium]|nr:phosphate/phosphite/phosphonate ABC transporter substrate-binding protein [Deltaproteobacteria bacterium]
MKRTAVFALIPALLLFSQDADAKATADKPSMVVCYTTGSVNVREARKATRSMLKVLEKIGGWDEGTFKSYFTTSYKDCGKYLADKKPHFIIPSLGFYLEHRKSDHLVPLAQPRVNGGSTDTWRVLVRKGEFKSLDDLKGKTLGGTLCTEPRFLKKVVFRGAVDPEKFFKLKPSKRALRPLRNLAAGRLDAVLINNQQYEALGSLPFAKDLEAVFTSKPMPLPGVFADARRSDQKERERFRKAMIAFCGHPDGKSFCELFGIDRFAQVNTADFDAAQALWDK